MSAQALQQALIAAARDPAQRATAVTALRGAEVWAATWPTDPATLRTLTNSNGVTALAVFSDEKQLEEAAIRYAWLGVDGRVPAKRLHVSEAMRFAKQHRAQLVVVDIAADHALELDEGEMELVSAPSMRPPSYQGMPPVRSKSSRPPPLEGMDVVRVSTRPAAEARPSRAPSTTAHQPVSVVPAPDKPGAVSATFPPAPNTATMRALAKAADDSLLDALTIVLKGYPEVEWASLVLTERTGGGEVPTVALRIEPQFRKNMAEISTRLRDVSGGIGEPVEVVLLDTPEQMKHARHMGKPFYPWRKK